MRRRIFDRRAVDSICFACKVVVSVEFYVLLKSYACTCYPELHVCAVKPAVVELVGQVESGVAERVRSVISIYIVYAECPGAWFSTSTAP